MVIGKYRKGKKIDRIGLCFVLFVLLPPFIRAQANVIKPYAPELFPSEVSGGILGFSTDGKTIYFVRDDALKKKSFMYQARKQGLKWTDVQLMSFSGVYNDMGGRLSRDGKTFYFTSDRPGGSSKEKDTWNIWFTKLSNNVWSQPISLNAINEKGLECCPLPLADGRLMFSADRGKPRDWWISVWNPGNNSEILQSDLNQHTAWQWPSSLSKNNKILFLNSMRRADSKGNDDIYISFYTNGKWAVPINIGEPVNSSFFEDGAILAPDEKLLIFNRHETPTTPSKVMSIEWAPILKRLKAEYSAGNNHSDKSR